MAGIDLHTHSTASDGSLTPRELVKRAQSKHLEALALTDHDTVKGLQEASACAQEYGIEFIRGCELSVQEGVSRMHILGLFLPENPRQLIQAMQELLALRALRNQRIATRLQELGVDVTYEEFVQEAAGGTIGRPHLARVLLRKKVVASFQEAFERYLGEGGQAYFPKEVFSPEKAIGLLKAQGAAVILAHPYSLNLDPAAERTCIEQLKEMGLDGIEAHYSAHTPAMTRHYLDLAQELDLAVSGGSDFHGAAKPGVELGTGKGSLHIPYTVLSALKDYHSKNNQQ